MLLCHNLSWFNKEKFLKAVTNSGGAFMCAVSVSEIEALYELFKRLAVLWSMMA